MGLEWGELTLPLRSYSGMIPSMRLIMLWGEEKRRGICHLERRRKGGE